MTDEQRDEHADNPIRSAIAEAIAENQVLLFMKGTPEQPACGFSARTVSTLQALDVPFAAVDILPAADPPGAVGAFELADDPAAVRRRRADRWL